VDRRDAVSINPLASSKDIVEGFGNTLLGGARRRVA